MTKTDDIYLLSFTEDELLELYEGLVLREELRGRREQTVFGESDVISKIARQFSNRSIRKVRENVLDEFDNYIDQEIDDSLMWQGIEDELKRRFDE